jgi:hypothetical protein
LCCVALDFVPPSPSRKGGNPMWSKPRFVEIKMDAEAKAYMDELAD